MKYIPNIITIARLIGTIPLIILICLGYIPNTFTFVLFLLLCISDFIDGAIARHFKLVSNFGKIIDGVADKFLMIGVIASLLFKQIVPFWTLAIILRDIISILGASYIIDETKVQIESNIFGKIKTTLYMIALLYTVLVGKWSIFAAIVLLVAIGTLLPEFILVKKRYKI